MRLDPGFLSLGIDALGPSGPTSWMDDCASWKGRDVPMDSLGGAAAPLAPPLAKDVFDFGFDVLICC